MRISPQRFIHLGGLEPALLLQSLRPQPLNLVSKVTMLELQLEAAGITLLFSFKLAHLFR